MTCSCRLLPWKDPDKTRMHQRACAVMAKVHRLNTIDGATPYPWTPDRRGYVRWLGITWVGVPAPIRWALSEDLSGPLEGCGCVRRLLVAWRVVRRRFGLGSTLPDHR